jgi:hypothetical protein
MFLRYHWFFGNRFFLNSRPIALISSLLLPSTICFNLSNNYMFVIKIILLTINNNLPITLWPMLSKLRVFWVGIVYWGILFWGLNMKNSSFLNSPLFEGKRMQLFIAFRIVETYLFNNYFITYLQSLPFIIFLAALHWFNGLNRRLLNYWLTCRLTIDG